MRNATAALTTLITEASGRVAMVFLSLATARLLEPFDIGVLGLAVIIVSLVSILGSYGETAAVIADQIPNEQKRAAAGMAWRFAVTFLVTVIVVVFIDRIALALGGNRAGADQVRDLTYLLLAQPWLEASGAFPRIVLRRRGEFAFLAKAGLVGTVLLVVSAILLLLGGHGPVAVVWGQLLAAAATGALAWSRLWGLGINSPMSHTLLSDMRAVASGALRLFVGSVGGFVSERLDNVLVAANLGPTQLSFYSVAWNLYRMPVNVLSQIVYTVVLPAVAIEKEAPVRVAQILRNTFLFSHLLMSLGGSLLFFVVPGLIEGVLGAKWLVLGPMFQIFALSFLFIPIHFASGSYLISHGRAHLMAIVSAVHILIQLLLIPTFCQRYGVIGAAYVDVGNNALACVTLGVALFLTGGNFKWFDWSGALRLSLAAALAASLSVGLLSTQTTLSAALSAALTFVLFPPIAAFCGAGHSLAQVSSLVGGWLLRVRESSDMRK